MFPNLTALAGIELEDVEFEEFNTQILHDDGGFDNKKMKGHINKYLKWAKENANNVTLIDRFDTFIDKDNMEQSNTGKRVFCTMRTVIAYAKIKPLDPKPNGQPFR